jgi:quercetin 2,3-dioxygenase
MIISKKKIKSIITSQKEEIMPGKHINVPFPSHELRHVSPYVLLHHFGPFEVNRDSSFSFDPHPHRGFEAVTILFEGEFEHRDSTGGYGKLSGGDVQWMTAGSGVIHVEKQPDEFIEKGGIVHGIQLWVNLPAENKMTEPHYKDIRKDTIPEISENGNKLRIIAGKYKNVTGPASTYTPMLVIHGLASGGSEINLEVPEKYNSLIYVTKGSISINDEILSKAQMALMETEGNNIKIKVDVNSEFMLLAGETIDEPVVQYGPFVMNSMTEIKQAFSDYQQGKFGNIN